MPFTLASLHTRYQAIFDADSEARFYKNVHLYWDYILRTPVLSDVVAASQKEYANKRGNLFSGFAQTEEEADDNTERTTRLEVFNLYAEGCTTLVRIYFPLEDYKNSLEEPEFDQDPCAVLMIRGVNRINPDYAKKNPLKWGHDKIKALNKWYLGQRPRYEGELKQFHLMLIDAIEKTDITASKETTFNTERSLLMIGDKHVRITLKNDKTNAHYVLKYLFDHGKAEAADFTDIINEYFPSEHIEWRSIYRACQDLEKKVREQAGITDFLTTTTGKTGYVRINSPYA